MLENLLGEVEIGELGAPRVHGQVGRPRFGGVVLAVEEGRQRQESQHQRGRDEGAAQHGGARRDRDADLVPFEVLEAGLVVVTENGLDDWL